MGVRIPSDNFDKIDLVKNLESYRNFLEEKQKDTRPLVVDHSTGYDAPLSLEWYDSVRFEENFNLMQSRKNKKETKKVNIVVARPVTRSQGHAATSSLPPGRNGRSRKKPEKYK